MDRVLPAGLAGVQHGRPHPRLFLKQAQHLVGQIGVVEGESLEHRQVQRPGQVAARHQIVGPGASRELRIDQAK